MTRTLDELWAQAWLGDRPEFGRARQAIENAIRSEERESVMRTVRDHCGPDQAKEIGAALPPLGGKS